MFISWLRNLVSSALRISWPMTSLLTIMLSADALQSLSYSLCHVYAPSTRSVSVPAPVYCTSSLQFATWNPSPLTMLIRCWFGLFACEDTFRPEGASHIWWFNYCIWFDKPHSFQEWIQAFTCQSAKGYVLCCTFSLWKCSFSTSQRLSQWPSSSPDNRHYAQSRLQLLCILMTNLIIFDSPKCFWLSDLTLAHVCVLVCFDSKVFRDIYSSAIAIL